MITKLSTPASWSTAGGGWLIEQRNFDARALAQLLMSVSREEILVRAERAYALRKTDACERVVNACEEIVN